MAAKICVEWVIDVPGPGEPGNGLAANQQPVITLFALMDLRTADRVLAVHLLAIGWSTLKHNIKASLTYC